MLVLQLHYPYDQVLSLSLTHFIPSACHYLTWPGQTKPWCQRQCSWCNLGQAIYKGSRQAQAKGARGRERREGERLLTGHRHRSTECGWRERETDRQKEREGSSQVWRTVWIPEDEKKPGISCKWHLTSTHTPPKCHVVKSACFYSGNERLCYCC